MSPETRDQAVKKKYMELRRKIFVFVRKHYDKTGKVPSVRAIRRKLKITNYMFKRAVSGGVKEICEVGGYPLPRDRFRAVEKAAAARRKKRAVAGVLPDVSLEGVEDPKIRKILVAAQKMKTRRDKADVVLKAQELERRLTREALEKEARLDPRKIADYVRFTNPRWGEDLDAFCSDGGRRLEDVCEEACRENPCEEGKDFDGYVKELLHDFDLRRRRAEIRKRSGEPYDLRCSCGLPYEYRVDKEMDKKGKVLYHYASFVCPLGHEDRTFPCSFCDELDGTDVWMAYDVGYRALRCPVCEELWEIKRIVYRAGSYLGGEEPLSFQEQKNTAAFVDWARKQQGGLHETLWKLSKYLWSLGKIEKEVAEGEEKLRRLGAVMAAATKEVEELRSLKDQLGRDVASLSRKKEELQGEMPRLTARSIDQMLKDLFARGFYENDKSAEKREKAGKSIDRSQRSI